MSVGLAASLAVLLIILISYVFALLEIKSDLEIQKSKTIRLAGAYTNVIGRLRASDDLVHEMRVRLVKLEERRKRRSGA